MNKSSLEIWNFYVSKEDKLGYIRALADNGLSNAQSAGLRAFMKLYCTNDDFRELVNPHIEKEKLKKRDGDFSVL